MAGAINNDAGVNAVAALSTFLLIRALRRGLTVLLALAIGLALAVLPLMKLTGFALYPAAVVGLIGLAVRTAHSPKDRKSRLRALLSVAVVPTTVLLSGAAWRLFAPIIGRNDVGAPQATAAPQEAVATGFVNAPGSYASYVWQVFLPRLPFMTDRHPQAWPAFDIYVERAWAAFGWYAVFFPIWVYVVIGVAMGVTAVLVGVAVVRNARWVAAHGWEIAVLGTVLVGVVVGVEIAYESPTPRPVIAEQGRYAFTALVPLGTLVGAACYSVRGRRRTVLATILVSSVLIASYASQLLVMSSFYA